MRWELFPFYFHLLELVKDTRTFNALRVLRFMLTSVSCLLQIQRTKTPDLVPEDGQPIWSKGVQSLPSTSTMKQGIRGFINKIYDLIGDPRIGPILLLAALMSFGTIWLRRSQPPQQSKQPNSNQHEQSQPNSKVCDGII